VAGAHFQPACMSRAFDHLLAQINEQLFRWEPRQIET
jgi:hypothetical protein